MKIKHLAYAVTLSALLTGAPLALAQTGQSGDNTSGRTGTASESVENRKDQALKPSVSTKDGVTIYKEQVIVIKDGVASRVTEKTKVADGLVVDKATITKNGQKVMLAQGQMLTFDGNLIEAPKEVQDRAAATSQGAITTKP